MTVLAAALAGCGPDEAGLASGARVRFSAPGYRYPRTGTVGQVGDCVVVMVPDREPEPRRFEVVPVEALERLELSSRFDGRPGPAGAPRTYTAGADTAGERWTPVDLRAVRRAHGGCAPS